MAQAVARRRFGLQRFPVVTAVVFAVTATVSVLGLAGALVVALLAGSPVPRLVPMVLLYWCGALLSVRWGTGPLVVCIAAAVAVQLVPAWTVVAGRLVAGAAIVAALALTAANDIHGAALLAGVLLAAATRRP